MRAPRIHVGSAVIHNDYNQVYTRLLANLGTMKTDILNQSSSTGEILVRCLSKPIDLILWRIYSDKALLKVIAGGKAETKVEVFAILSPFRIAVRQHEELVDMDNFLSTLRKDIG